MRKGVFIAFTGAMVFSTHWGGPMGIILTGLDRLEWWHVIG
jgi:hypothetical protein